MKSGENTNVNFDGIPPKTATGAAVPMGMEKRHTPLRKLEVWDIIYKYAKEGGSNLRREHDGGIRCCM